MSVQVHLLHQIALVIQDHASGFRVNPCIIAPETANPAPTKIAATSRGKRISRIIDILSPLAEEVSADHTSFIEYLLDT